MTPSSPPRVSPSGAGQKPLIIAYRLGAKNQLPTSSPASTRTTAPSSATPSTTTTGTTGSSAASTASTVSLGALDDQLAFTADQETANAGKVTVDFTNNSALQHDVVLTDSQNKIVGQTPVFQGGSKSFTATLAPGTYTYYCSVPGQRQAGMQGTLTVK